MQVYVALAFTKPRDLLQISGGYLTIYKRSTRISAHIFAKCATALDTTYGFLVYMIF